MDRYIAALVLNDIGTLLELNGADPFRARAFYAAARALEHAEGELDELVRTRSLQELPGVGATSARVVQELVETGGSTLHAQLRQRTPQGMVEMLAVPGLGARRIHLLHEALGIQTLDELEEAAAAGTIAAVSGFGAKTQEKIRQGISFVRSSYGRRRQPEALRAAERLVGFLEGLPEVARVKVAGELRRRLETVGSVDTVVGTTSPGVVIDAFLALPGVVSAVREGDDAASARYSDGVPLRVRCVSPDAFASAWLLGTGSDEHVAEVRKRAKERGLRIAADGLWRGRSRLAVEDEAAIYAHLGLPFVPPELREGRGELEAAEAGTLPSLVDYADLRGCFHCHTDASDGKATLDEMAEAAIELGWSYLGIADHSQAASYAGGLTVEQIREQHAAIDAWNAKRGRKLWLFKGIEADILPDGRVDYDEHGDEVLGSFDYVVASVHSSFAQGEAEQTARVKRALANPHVTFLGHPTGRLLLSRDAYRLDVRAVIEEAARQGVGIEINADPHRLELDWRWWDIARSLGVRCAVNPDAHSTLGIRAVEYGVGIARKGGLSAGDVVNAWPRRKVKAYLVGRKHGKR